MLYEQKFEVWSVNSTHCVLRKSLISQIITFSHPSIFSLLGNLVDYLLPIESILSFSHVYPSLLPPVSSKCRETVNFVCFLLKNVEILAKGAKFERMQATSAD